MVIAVNMVQPGNFPKADIERLQEIFAVIAEKHPQHRFVYITDGSIKTGTVAANISTATITPLPGTALLRRYWYDYKLPALLKKIGAGIFITPYACSSRTRIPQYLLLNDTAFVFAPQHADKRQIAFYKNSLARSLAKATHIFTLTDFAKQGLAEKFATDPGKITAIYKGSKAFVPKEWEEKEIVKERYTEGKEYFLYLGDISPAGNTINLLKAFSHFKKWQKSNMQLVIAGNIVPGYDRFKDDLGTYKYRNEVKLLENVSAEDTAMLLPSAYALVHPVCYDELPAAALSAFTCGVPVIVPGNSGLQEQLGEAALYAAPGDFKSIAEQMMLVFKDENRRNSLILHGGQLAKRFTWENTAGLLWDVIAI